MNGEVKANRNSKKRGERREKVWVRYGKIRVNEQRWK